MDEPSFGVGGDLFSAGVRTNSALGYETLPTFIGVLIGYLCITLPAAGAIYYADKTLGTLGVVVAALWFFPQGDLLVGVLVITAFVFSDLLDGTITLPFSGDWTLELVILPVSDIDMTTISEGGGDSIAVGVTLGVAPTAHAGGLPVVVGLDALDPEIGGVDPRSLPPTLPVTSRTAGSP